LIIAIPVWPINGNSQVIPGKGVHTMQCGNLAFSGFILPSSLSFLAPILIDAWFVAKLFELLAEASVF